MSKPKRIIHILDGQWLRAQYCRIDWLYDKWPTYDGGPVWYNLPRSTNATLSYIKLDGTAHAVRIYNTDQSERKSGRYVMRYSTTPTPDEQPIFSVTRTVTQEECDLMQSDTDEVEWSV